MASNNQSIIYVAIKGSSQGQFKSDESRAGGGKSTAIAFRGKVVVPHDTQGKNGKGVGVAQNEPTWIVCEWNALLAQSLQAAWNNSEPLEEVSLTFVRRDPGGTEKPYAEMKLKKATLAGIDFGVADTAEILPGQHEYRDLARIGFLAEEIEFESKGEGGATKATFKRKADS